MQLIQFALRRPFTVMVLIAGIVCGSFLAVGHSVCQQFGLPYPDGLPKGMEVDIFPKLNLPVIYVCQPYGGMDPAQMEGFLTNYYEYHFLYMNGIHHVESRNVQGTALMKLYFHPGTDMAQAMAETINYVNRSQAFMPPGTVSPFVMRFDTGSVPVGYLVMSSETRSITEIQDVALLKRAADVLQPARRLGPAAVWRERADHRRHGRPATAAGVPHDAGGSRHSDQQREFDQPLRQPAGGRQVPDRAGQLRHQTGDPVGVDIPVRMGANPVYIRDIGYATDAGDVPAGYALVNGRRAVYILATKRADASTMSVIHNIKTPSPTCVASLGEAGQGIDVAFEFDQSPYVTRAVSSVIAEGCSGRCSSA